MFTRIFIAQHALGRLEDWVGGRSWDPYLRGLSLLRQSDWSQARQLRSSSLFSSSRT